MKVTQLKLVNDVTHMKDIPKSYGNISNAVIGIDVPIPPKVPQLQFVEDMSGGASTMRGVAEHCRFKVLEASGVRRSIRDPSPGGGGFFLDTCVLRRLLPRLRVAANGAAASSRARAPAGHYIFLQSKEQGSFPFAHITIR
ncbi:hypothetical protein GUJ93_ZPchr0002g23390 [Zizania palustris]|uniref:Uncharacterized protein n=1 Tax=Zizania palustris TaxID=103762 RepID=A0A8J5VEA8_ZIZPA|nr:hypothetical protein GUJ93_ZPchr0002g23390 [Zizania palustris]